MVVAGLLPEWAFWCCTRTHSFLFQGLAQRGWPLLLLSAAAGLVRCSSFAEAALAGNPRPCGAGGGEHGLGFGRRADPYLLPQSLTIFAAGTPRPCSGWSSSWVAALPACLPLLILRVPASTSRADSKWIPLEIGTHDLRMDRFSANALCFILLWAVRSRAASPLNSPRG